MQSSKKILIIVESPGKIKKIQEYLGKNYIIKASCGHIRDLDKKTLSIDISNNMVPLYTINNDKIKIIADLKKYSNQVSQIMLATDADREGEAIAYSLAEVLKIKNPVRIIFNEITKSALLKAVDNPTTINDNIVKAQQTRRILDRLVGYMITPLLWKYIVNDASIQSTGRVQSAALQIIIDKENKINNHNFIKDYKVILNVSYLKNNIEEKLISTLEFIDKHESSSSTEEDKNTFTFFNEESEIYTFLNKINKFSIFKIVNRKGSTINKSPPYPYITSSLQQDAYTKLHFSIKKTMLMAQKLYENGLITYMRTDSPNISNTVINKIKDYIYENHGENYYKYRTYKSNNVQSQDAHECIRPTNVSLSNINLSTDENKLYNLIWKRTIASQMSDAKLLETKIYIDILNDNNSILIFNKSKAYFINTCTSIIFDGFLVLYNEKSFSETDNIQLDTELSFNNINIFDEYKKMPMRYNEANLVKHLEKQGIGRPSTFVPTLTKLLDKKYIDIKDIEGIQKPIKTFILTNTLETKVSETSKIIGNESKKIVPTELGIEINKFIDKHFNELLNINFTSELEKYLDKIALGTENWLKIVTKFYTLLDPIVCKLKSDSSNIIVKNNNEQELGKYKNNIIYKGTNKIGNYVKIYENKKWKYACVLKNFHNITLEEAISLLSFPRRLGKYDNKIIDLKYGIYGYYIAYNKKNFKIPSSIDIDNITLDQVIKIINK